MLGYFLEGSPLLLQYLEGFAQLTQSKSVALLFSSKIDTPGFKQTRSTELLFWQNHHLSELHYR